MTKLSTKERDKIPTKKFGLPETKKYPMPDRTHAVDAKARASQMVNKGKLSEANKVKIDRKADAVIATTTKLKK